MINTFRQKLSGLFSDEKFSEILTGSFFALFARLMGTGLALVVSLLVAKIYGAKMMGVLAIVQSFMMMATILAIMGTRVSILRLIPEHIARYSVNSAFHAYRKTQSFVILSSLFIGGTLFFYADVIADRVFSKPHFSFYIGITALCVIFKALMDLNTQAVRGLRLIRTFAFMQVFPNAAFLTILLTLTALYRQANDPVYAQLSAWGLAAIVGALIMRRAFHRRIQPEDFVCPMPLRDLLALSAPMFMSDSMNFIIGQVGVLVLGMYRSASEVGHYAVAVKLAVLTSFMLQAINSMAAPKFSELFHDKRMDDLFYVAKKSTKLIFWTTTPILFFLIILGHPILAFFGPGFTIAYVPLLILVVGQFINSICGSTGYFMNMTGSQIVYRNIIGVASVLYLLLAFTLIPRFGLLGAALTATASQMTWNIWALYYIKSKYGRTIGYFPFPKNWA